jgi:hypothetical protein
MMLAQRFQVGERVCVLQPIGWLNKRSRGTIARVFFGFDTYGVCFDEAESIHVVPGHLLEHLSD